MLHNVPVARILGFLSLASVTLIVWITYEGFRVSAGALGAGAHIRFALFGIVVVLFTHTMTLFYFVGTGSRIKTVVREHALQASLPDHPPRLRPRRFPCRTFTPLVRMSAFVVGSGATLRVSTSCA